VDAEKAYNEAIKAEPDNEDALTGLALLYSDVGDTRRAIEKLKAVTDKNPSERTLALLARAYRELRDYKSAADALQKAVALAPDDTRLIAELADNLFLCNQLDDALHLYQQLAADDPQNPMLPLRISEIYRVKRDFAKARETLAKAKTLDPDSLDVRIDEINLLETEGKTNEAIASLKGLLDETARKNYSAADAANRATGEEGEPLKTMASREPCLCWSVCTGSNLLTMCCRKSSAPSFTRGSPHRSDHRSQVYRVPFEFHRPASSSPRRRADWRADSRTSRRGIDRP